MTLQHFKRAELAATPWKNGGGMTREIACHPAHAGLQDFDWRISIAHITTDGDFSMFPGIDRVITLLEGGGVQLHSADGSIGHALDSPLQPFAFAGDVAVHGRLLNADCHDLNVMTRRTVCQAAVVVARNSELFPPAPAGLLMAIRGDWQVQAPGPATGQATSEAEAFSLTPQTGFWWQGKPLGWQCTCSHADAALLAVRITPVPR